MKSHEDGKQSGDVGRVNSVLIIVKPLCVNLLKVTRPDGTKGTATKEMETKGTQGSGEDRETTVRSIAHLIHAYIVVSNYLRSTYPR